MKCNLCEEECEMQTCCDIYNSENCYEVPVCINKDCENYDEIVEEEQ